MAGDKKCTFFPKWNLCHFRQLGRLAALTQRTCTFLTMQKVHPFFLCVQKCMVTMRMKHVHCTLDVNLTSEAEKDAFLLKIKHCQGPVNPYRLANSEQLWALFMHIMLGMHSSRFTTNDNAYPQKCINKFNLSVPQLLHECDVTGRWLFKLFHADIHIVPVCGKKE